jgi:Flp pilus assembly pilin Flp
VHQLIRLRRLARDARGIAMLEFALIAPVFLVTLLFGLEIVMFALAQSQVSRVANSTADLAARYRASIDEADVQQLFLGARLSAEGIDFAENGRLLLSSVTRNQSNDGHWIRWQRCEGALDEASTLGAQGDGQTGTAIATVDGLTLNTGDNIMVAEAIFDYQPFIYPEAVFDAIFGGRRITYRSSYMAREIALPTITNTTGIAASAWQTMANGCPASS